MSCRLGVSVLAVVCALPLPLLPAAGARWLPCLSPFLAIGSVLSRVVLPVVSLLAAVVLAVAIFRRRWFCRYLCPTGLLLEYAGRLRPAAVRTRHTAWGNVGPLVLLVALGGAAAGWPHLLWLDPLSIFNGAVSACRPWVSAAQFLPAVGLALLAALALWRPNLWCYHICPLGALQELVGRRRVAAPSAVSGTPSGTVSQPSCSGRFRLDTSRRRFAAALGGFTLGGLTRLGWPPRRASVRPPGALAEARFAGVCVRCGNCISHCPAGILRPDTDPVGLFGLAAPVVRFGPDYCREDCNRCGQVCPTGAIRALDLPAKRQAVMGVAVIKREHCVCWVKEEQCMACADVCPYDAVRTVPSRTVDFPSVRIEACLGCGACEIACPAATLAIVVEPPDGVSGPPAR